MKKKVAEQTFGTPESPNSFATAMMGRLGKLRENVEVRLSELAHGSNSVMFLTPSGDVFWRPVGDMCVCVCACASVSVNVNMVC